MTDHGLKAKPEAGTQLECMRRGIRGTKSLWRRVLTYRDADAHAAVGGAQAGTATR